MEVELVALKLAGSEAKWLKVFLFELFVVEKSIPAMLIYCDIQATLAKVKSKNHNSKSSRHNELRYKILRNLNTIRTITLSYVTSKKNLTDHLKKGLSRGHVLKCSIRMGLKPIS